MNVRLLGMFNAIINKDREDEDLDKLFKSFGDVRSCQVFTMTAQTDSECPSPLYSTPLWPCSLALISRLLQVHY